MKKTGDTVIAQLSKVQYWFQWGQSQKVKKAFSNISLKARNIFINLFLIMNFVPSCDTYLSNNPPLFCSHYLKSEEDFQSKKDNYYCLSSVLLQSTTLISERAPLTKISVEKRNFLIHLFITTGFCLLLWCFLFGFQALCLPQLCQHCLDMKKAIIGF